VQQKKNGHANGSVGSVGDDDHKSFSLSFLPSLPTPHARSSFVALSGLGDNFTTIEDLCTSTRDGVFLESAVIPHLEISPDETGSRLNAYLLDFYMHESLEPLESANGIRKSDVSFFKRSTTVYHSSIQTCEKLLSSSISCCILLWLDKGLDYMISVYHIMLHETLAFYDPDPLVVSNP